MRPVLVKGPLNILCMPWFYATYIMHDLDLTHFRPRKNHLDVILKESLEVPIRVQCLDFALVNQIDEVLIKPDKAMLRSGICDKRNHLGLGYPPRIALQSINNSPAL